MLYLRITVCCFQRSSSVLKGHLVFLKGHLVLYLRITLWCFQRSSSVLKGHVVLYLRITLRCFQRSSSVLKGHLVLSFRLTYGQSDVLHKSNHWIDPSWWTN